MRVRGGRVYWGGERGCRCRSGRDTTVFLALKKTPASSRARVDWEAPAFEGKVPAFDWQVPVFCMKEQESHSWAVLEERMCSRRCILKRWGGPPGGLFRRSFNTQTPTLVERGTQQVEVASLGPASGWRGVRERVRRSDGGIFEPMQGDQQPRCTRPDRPGGLSLWRPLQGILRVALFACASSVREGTPMAVYSNPWRDTRSPVAHAQKRRKICVELRPNQGRVP